MSTVAADAGFQWVCYHAAGSIFTIGVTEETALNAAIPPKPGPPGTRSLRARGGKPGWKEWPHLANFNQITVIVKMLYRLHANQPRQTSVPVASHLGCWFDALLRCQHRCEL